MVHSHSQIIALPVVPKAAEDEFAGSKDFYEKSGGKCVFCEVIRFDLRTKTLRLIDKSEHFITLAPFAARFPYETWVLPRKHNSNFGAISDDEVCINALCLFLHDRSSFSETEIQSFPHIVVSHSVRPSDLSR